MFQSYDHLQAEIYKLVSGADDVALLWVNV
jgi:hypothetical protein